MRSKTLLVSNIFATIYSAVLLWIFGGAIIEAVVLILSKRLVHILNWRLNCLV
ncbi:hypothetical protein [Massiliimalia timonensis]|uniref:hypothetical protein n=1 Tax=Massiliimalia timonensis TaxID=1987501 RepID=UPI00131A291B|nr:hypothetical protein [Massiliimalia timonensis]MBS7175431.1 hypothetical protein [Clostridiales bacterium]